MTSVRFSLVRDLIAFVLIAAACPIALFGGSMLGCVGQGFNASCAIGAIVISPVVLLFAGFLTGLVTRGWTGLLIAAVGTVAGMTTILFLSFGVGQPVPLDPVSGVIATVWFMGPIVIGYGLASVVVRLLAARPA